MKNVVVVGGWKAKSKKVKNKQTNTKIFTSAKKFEQAKLPLPPPPHHFSNGPSRD